MVSGPATPATGSTRRSACTVRNRVYDAELVRWTRRDPLGYAAGLNLYPYAEAPAAVTDPTGLLTVRNAPIPRTTYHGGPTLGCAPGGIAQEITFDSGATFDTGEDRRIRSVCDSGGGGGGGDDGCFGTCLVWTFRHCTRSNADLSLVEDSSDPGCPERPEWSDQIPWEIQCYDCTPDHPTEEDNCDEGCSCDATPKPQDEPFNFDIEVDCGQRTLQYNGKRCVYTMTIEIGFQLVDDWDTGECG